MSIQKVARGITFSAGKIAYPGPEKNSLLSSCPKAISLAGFPENEAA
jgi:hypothetical protein